MIYFLQAGEGGHVKIGWTKDQSSLKRRVASLQCGQPVKLIVIRTVEAPRPAEAWFHGFFSAFRLVGEWFAYQKDMLIIEPPSEPPPGNLEDPLNVYVINEGELTGDITPGQVRAARALLGWDQVTLARMAQISVSVIKDIERSSRTMRPSTLMAIEAAFGRAGLVFLHDGPDGGVGVRLARGREPE